MCIRDRLETEHENLKKQLRQVLGAKNRLGQQMDNLDSSDKMYDRKYQDMQDGLNGLYDEIERLESLIDDIVSRKDWVLSRFYCFEDVRNF